MTAPTLGLCPACGRDSLTLSATGRVVCIWMDCVWPDGQHEDPAEAEAKP